MDPSLSIDLSSLTCRANSNQQTHVPALSSTLPASSAGYWLPLYEYFFWKLRLEMIVQMYTAVMSVYLWCVLAEMSSSWVERVPVLDLILQGHLST